jgi:hypothetical protein
MTEGRLLVWQENRVSPLLMLSDEDTNRPLQNKPGTNPKVLALNTTDVDLCFLLKITYYAKVQINHSCHSAANLSYLDMDIDMNTSTDTNI